MYLPNGVFFSLIFIVSILTASSIPGLYAQESSVTAKSVGFDETTIIEFTNAPNSDAPIDTIRLWLGSDFNFKSFKTEKGWTGQKTPEGLLVFTTSNPVQPGEVVKFGVKTDKPKPGINWKALEGTDNQIAIGKTLVSDAASLNPANEVTAQGIGVLESSKFRLIPEKPSVGSTVRVTGDNFAPNHKLDFYIGTKKVQTFDTDNNGHFIFTSTVPSNQAADRVDFKIVDSEGNEKSISLRLGEETKLPGTTEKVSVTVNQISPVVNRGETIKVSGTGTPGSTITATVKDETDKVLTTIAVNVDQTGKWKYEAVVPIDAPLGDRVVEITDGTSSLIKHVTVASSKKVEISPLKVMFQAGETVIFNGTAKPNEELEIIVQDPQGSEFFSKILTVDASGKVNLEFPTMKSSPEGTYVLFATQGEDTDIALVGLGELPEEKLVAKPDKLNYSQGQKVNLELQGPASATLSLLIVDPSDKNKFSDTIILGPDGQKKYQLDLTGYSSGVYTAVLSRGNSQTSAIFSVGLQTGSGPIDARTTKDTYQPGETILILGQSSKNILLTLKLIDPDGKVVKTKDTFTNKDGVFSDSSFKIPVSAVKGLWTINARSGSNFDDVKISVQTSKEEGMSVYVDNVTPSTGGKIVTLKGYGAAVSQLVVISIYSDTNEKITDLTIVSTGVGDFSTIWLVDNTIPSGTYTIKAIDAQKHEAETTVLLK